MSKWTQVAVCLKCREVVSDSVPFGDLFFVHVEVCPHCGHPKVGKRIYTLTYFGFEIALARHVRNDGASIIKPWTWFGWHWEFKPVGEEQKSNDGDIHAVGTNLFTIAYDEPGARVPPVRQGSARRDGADV